MLLLPPEREVPPLSFLLDCCVCRADDEQQQGLAAYLFYALESFRAEKGTTDNKRATFLAMIARTNNRFTRSSESTATGADVDTARPSNC